MHAAAAVLSCLCFAPPAPPAGEAARAAERWRAEYDKQLPVAKAAVKSLRNATGRRGLAAKADAEKTLRKMGAEPYYVRALREHDGDHDTTGVTACLRSSSVKIVMDLPGGWLGEIEFGAPAQVAGGGVIGSGGDTIAKRLFFHGPAPVRPAPGRVVELTGFFYSPGEQKVTYPNGAESRYTALVPVEIDPADRPAARK